MRVRPVKGRHCNRSSLRKFISTEEQKAKEPCRVRVVPSRGRCYHQTEGRRGWAV